MSKLLKIILSFLRMVIILIPIVLLGWLIYKDLVFSGQLEAVYDFRNISPFISVLRPADRVSEPRVDSNGDYYQNLYNQPVYFDIRLPTKFNMAKIKLKYRNIDQSVFQLGVLVDKERWLFDLKPIENQIVEYLIQDKFHWQVISEGETILFQNTDQYETISDFLSDLPSLEKIAVYNYKIPIDFKLPNYQPKETGIEINKSLRGSHRLYTYIKNEPLNFTFFVQDLNRHPGEDYLSIDIYHGDNLIFSKFIEDDGNTSDNLKMSETQKIDVGLGDLSEGVYKIELITTSDDITFRRTITNQDLLVFINNLYLADDVGYIDDFSTEREAPLIIYTNGHLLSAYTSHLEGLQTLLINEKLNLKINETHRWFKKEMPFGLKSIVVPSSDIKLETKGLFSFSKETFFNPEITSLADGLDFDRENVDYVITNYLPSKEEGGWRVKEIDFNLANYYTDDDKLHFVLSLPYLEEGQQGVNISEIDVKLKRLPLTGEKIVQKIKTLLTNVVNRDE